MDQNDSCTTTSHSLGHRAVRLRRTAADGSLLGLARLADQTRESTAIAHQLPEQRRQCEWRMLSQMLGVINDWRLMRRRIPAAALQLTHSASRPQPVPLGTRRLIHEAD